ncbi:hypothetical protein CHARACLAT_004402 [Characodon lateralis]|uniref:Uncharacterized protein n=1 Tax=Characodon lateralis TaxID=208331 RepID=A0ABU7D613_9TELE|nr:hypothetical protein [Characodon lateralis]
MSSADKRGGTQLKVLKNKASEGDWMMNQVDRMLIGRPGDAQRRHWTAETVRCPSHVSSASPLPEAERLRDKV